MKEHGGTPGWHALEAGRVAEMQRTDANGLSEEEAAQRLVRYGLNRLPEPPPRPAWLRFALQFHNVLIYVMLVAAAITLALGHLTDTAVLLFAVLVNACVGFIQEGRAEQSIAAIRNTLSPHAAVLRNGERMDLAAELLVPGDVVLLAAGDKVPADLRLFDGKELRVNEAILTGESEVSEKSPLPVEPDAPLGDRSCMLYSGTLAVSGQASGIVVATGAETEIGRIGTLLQNVQPVATPLLRRIAGFGRWLSLAILLMAAATFFAGILWRGQPADQMFLMVVALAASAIPEGLPAVMTITLALGVRRMAGYNAIIRHLPAVETLGSVTVVCSDKTGTLTRNEMTVQRAITSRHAFDISGAGYAPEGALHLDGAAIRPDGFADLTHLLRASILCNDARLGHRSGGEWKLHGDPTEGALLTLALKGGFDPAAERAAFPRIDVIPFESQHRLMATLHHDREGHGVIYVKGAPERILSMCERQGTESSMPVDCDYWRRHERQCAGNGLRLLAFAMKTVNGAKRDVTFHDLEGGFTLVALVGLIDPPREESAAAVAACAAAGIRVKMITGDHADTARAIGTQLGIGTNRQVLTGVEIESMSDAELRRAVVDADLFARASPEHKLRLVEALQAENHVVAMTGDGVNDAPALKRADIGIAMGKKGTEAAKEASDMVLADDNFATIGHAVREGRGIYDNIQKFILFMLPTNGGEALVVIAAVLFELALPLTPAQVLWINLATSSTLGLALAFEHPERDVMRRRPRDPRAPLFSWFFAWRVAMVSVLMMAAALGLFLWEIDHGASLETARTMAVSAVVFAEMFYLLNSRYVFRSVLSRDGLLGNRYALLAIAACAALQIVYIYAEPLQAVFGSTGLAPVEWMKVFMAGLLVFACAEMEKILIRAWRRKTLGTPAVA